MQSVLRKDLLDIFFQAEGGFVSGQKISELLGCSRTAVWKHIEDLRTSGYEVEAIQRKGYRIIKVPDKISRDIIQMGLKTKRLGQKIVYEESLPSTQKLAHQQSLDGSVEGTVILAEEQTAGRGRLDRTWYSPKSTGIWMSIILRPQIPPQKAPQLTLLAAVSIVLGIQEATGLQCEIKWPNDILIKGKKLAGILTELESDADRINAVIMGIGLNINQLLEHFPEELQDKATSLRVEGNQIFDRAEIVRSILFQLEKLYDKYLEYGFEVIKILWESFAISIGRPIIARTLNGAIEGTAQGITEEGVLILEDENGTIHHIYSADIELH